MNNAIKNKDILENIDKKLVNDGILLFNRLNENKSFNLTNDGMIEMYDNDKYKDRIPFSKLGIMRECKLLIQEGYNLMEFEHNDTSTTMPSQEIDDMKKSLEQDIENVDEIQELKNELEDKLDNLQEATELENEYALVLYTNINGQLEPNVTVSNVENDVLSFADNIEETKLFEKDLAEYYASQYNEKNDDTQILKAVKSDDLDSLQTLFKTKNNIQENLETDNFPSNEFSEKILTTEELKNIDLMTELSIEQVAWIQTRIGKLSLVENGLKDLAASIKDNRPIVSIDSYVQQIENIMKGA